MEGALLEASAVPHVLNNTIGSAYNKQMDKKRLSPKEIFRTLAFHYHLDDAIPIDLLAEMVSSLYYPVNPEGEAKLKYKKLLVGFMKEYNSQEKTMSEEKFIKFLQEMTKHGNEEYLKKLTDRIFSRYSNREEGVIDELGFKRMALAFGIAEQDAREYFLTVADLKNQITREKFQDYMGGLVAPKRF